MAEQAQAQTAAADEDDGGEIGGGVGAKADEVDDGDDAEDRYPAGQWGVSNDVFQDFKKKIRPGDDGPDLEAALAALVSEAVFGKRATAAAAEPPAAAAVVVAAVAAAAAAGDGGRQRTASVRGTAGRGGGGARSGRSRGANSERLRTNAVAVAALDAKAPPPSDDTPKVSPLESGPTTLEFSAADPEKSAARQAHQGQVTKKVAEEVEVVEAAVDSAIERAVLQAANAFVEEKDETPAKGHPAEVEDTPIVSDTDSNHMEVDHLETESGAPAPGPPPPPPPPQPVKAQHLEEVTETATAAAVGGPGPGPALETDPPEPKDTVMTGNESGPPSASQTQTQSSESEETPAKGGQCLMM
ncbi:hypothetical protein DFJ73DRAFT_173490 [Zopfochytrium polystomum]|nr:hypothetical protein DFJ73DRAFT_173490 [Zopfochytrium polystomum]